MLGVNCVPQKAAGAELETGDPSYVERLALEVSGGGGGNRTPLTRKLQPDDGARFRLLSFLNQAVRSGSVIHRRPLVSPTIHPSQGDILETGIPAPPPLSQ